MREKGRILLVGFIALWENRYGCFLKQMLEGIDTRTLKWQISGADVHRKGDEILLAKGIFPQSCMTDDEFRSAISKNDYYTIFLTLRGFTFLEKDAPDFMTYEEYLQSNCEIIILCSDVSCYEVYAKSPMLLEVIAKNTEKYAKAIEYIMSPDAITRSEFFV